MLIRADYHIHTKFSGDSKNELEAIVKKAIDLGLEEIAITDHGPAHNGYGINKRDYPIIRKEIDRLNIKYPSIKILLGLEANFLGTEGEIDIDEDMKEMIDWINAGYHFGSNFRKDIKIHFYNVMSKVSKHYHKKARELNTQSMVNAMKKNKINVLTHPGAKGPIDIEVIAKTASETGTLLEINNQHGHLSVEEIKAAMKYPVQFVLCSDAHEINEVGDVVNALDRAYIAGLNMQRIYNIKPSHVHVEG